MPKESAIRKRAIEILEKEGWIVWFAPRVKYRQTDIFGTFDMICCKKGVGRLKFIQLTTVSNLSTRRKKVKNFFKKNKINSKMIRKMRVELWAWSKRNKAFKIELI